MFEEGRGRSDARKGPSATSSARVAARLLLLLTISCSSARPVNPRDIADANDVGRTVSAQSETERRVLAELPQLPNGLARQIGDASVSAEAPYAAASGRMCRALVLRSTRATSHRLACSGQGGWVFVPDVFGSTNDGSE